MFIKIDQFHGMRPQLASRKLGMYESHLTHNSRLWRGDISPYDAPLPLELLTKSSQSDPIRSIFRLNGKTLNWTTDVDIVRSPTSRDTHDRYYYTGDGAPKTTTQADATVGPDFPTTFYDTGIPAPITAPTITVAGGSGDVTTRSYVYRYTNDRNEVGPASPATEATGFVNGNWTVTGVPPSTARNWNLNGLQYQFYRSDQNGTMRFVAQQAAATLVDTAPDTTLAEALPTVEFLPPPADLKGLVVLPNGFLAGFRENEVWFSEPFQPQAWPDAYLLKFEDTIVALGVYSTTLVVATTGRPSVLSGVHPSSMIEDKLDVQYACVSKRSMVTIGQGVMYAAPEGLVYVTGRSARLNTEPLMERPDWDRYSPSTMLGTTYDDRYLGFFTPANGPSDEHPAGGFMLDPHEPIARFMRLTAHATAVAFERSTGNTHMAIDGVLHQFDAHKNQLQGYWCSKRFLLPRKVAFGVAKVRWTPNADLTLEDLRAALANGIARLVQGLLPNGIAPASGAFGHHHVLQFPILGSSAVTLITTLAQIVASGVTFRLWHDDVLVHTEEPVDSELFRITHRFGRHDEWWLEVTAHQADIHEVVVAESPSELAAA